MRRLLPLLLLVSLAAPAGDPPLPSVDDPPDLAMGAVGDFAVIVGVPTYPFIPARPVAYAQQDAQAMVRFVEESRGVPADRVRLLLGNDATRERMLQVLTEAGTRTGANGVVWLYFAGHGSADPDTGERILLPVDAQEDALSFRAKGVRVDEAVRAASAGGARVVVIADACYTGVGKGRFSVDMDWLPPEASVAELTATKSGEVAMPLDAAKHGAFTFAMLGALRGWADGTGGPKDGVVTMAEAAAYTSSALDAMGFDQQDPFPAYAGGMTDQFALVSKGRGVFDSGDHLA